MNPRFVRRVLICLALVTPAFAGSGLAIAAGPAVCLPPGIGVPGQPGVPDWWTASPAPPITDPRWQGSFGVGHVQDNAQFRALFHEVAGQKFLVLSWHVKADPGANPGVDDILFLGFNNTTTNKTTALTFKWAPPSPAGPGVVVATKTVSLFTRTGTTGSFAVGTVPATLDAQTLITADCNGLDPATCADWSIRTRIPIGATGIDLGPTFKMWYELQRTSIPNPANPPLVDEFKWPEGVLADAVDADPVPSFPAGAAELPEWASVTLGGASCANGVELRIEKIWVNAPGNTRIDLAAQNVFHADPQLVQPSGSFGHGAIKAQFRIANWGSAVGDSPQWINVPGVDTGSNCGAAVDSAAGSVTSMGYWDIAQCKWTLNAAEKCAYRADQFPGCTMPAWGPRLPHQCIMVDLSANGGATVQFARDSAWNNFDFGPASLHEEPARIDVRGLAAVPGNPPQRDVYVFIKALNMPERITPPDAGAQSPEGVAAGGNFANNAVRERLAQLPIRKGQIGSKEAALLRSLVGEGRLTYDDLEQVMPTYIAYVWHDTGRTRTNGTTTAKIIAPQPAFGLFMHHDGPLYGWRYGLSGPGVEKIGWNFYRVSAPSDGFVDVKVSVEALEQPPTPPPPPPGPCGQIPPWAIVLIIVLILVIVLLKRKKQP